MSSVQTSVVLTPMRAAGTAVPTAKVDALSGRQDLVEGGKQSPPQQSGSGSPERTREAVAVVERNLGEYSHSLKFEVDDKSGVSVVTVLDRETGQVVRQIPSDEVLATARFIAESMGEVNAGVLLNAES